MELIQNIGCIEVNLNPVSERYYFQEKDFPEKAIIQRIWVVMAELSDTEMGSPFSQEETDNDCFVSRAGNESIFFNLSNSKKEIIKGLPMYAISQENNNFDFSINSVIDPLRSYVAYKILAKRKLLVYFTYNYKSPTVKNDIVSGAFNCTVKLNAAVKFQSINLGDLIPESFENFKIKKIFFDFTKNTFLYLKTDKGVIDNMYLNYIVETKRKSVLFDDLKIDFKESFLNYRNNDYPSNNINITFYF